MTNSINGTPRNRTEILGNQSNKTEKANEVSTSNESNKASSTSSSDTVSITNEANKIRELQASLADVPDIDLQKVESIKQEIANGNYPIDHERIASNLLDLEKSLL
ncbi:MAG: flagellar biosynthesis anti-sigma factor FlgM [Gammaproteobacteria bacterium]|nr:flagellar biosynthesis anti-sigma factor FlgM [Gammaproteobacteria bacterium]